MSRSKQSPSADAAQAPGTADGQQQQQQAEAGNPSREDRIRQAAYAAAERRGFAPGGEVDDWLEAERQLGQDSAHKPG